MNNNRWLWNALLSGPKRELREWYRDWRRWRKWKRDFPGPREQVTRIEDKP